MPLAPLLSFASGELDPILTDNVTLDKFRKGLATCRNGYISKTGSILSRFATLNGDKAKNNGEKIKVYCPPNTDYLLEFGVAYVRVYIYFGFEQAFSLAFQVERAHALTEDDLVNLHFETNKDFVYIFCSGKTILKLQLAGISSDFISSANIFKVPNPLSAITVTQVGASTAYNVDYLATLMINGEESLSIEITTGYPKPIASGQSNLVKIVWPESAVDFDSVKEVRVYSRPTNGGAYGFLGSTTKINLSGSNREAFYIDIGSLPDFGNGTQDLITRYGLSGEEIIDLKPKTGIVYQQRLIINPNQDKEAILASRPGFTNNFYRDFPYAADSALQFKAGTSGKANIIRFLEHEGLIAFTTNGIYTNSGLLNINNVAMERRGPWIIKDDIPPLAVPGAVFFVDRSNTIRQLIFSQEIQAYQSIEQTIFSNHLFKKRTIKSWCYQDGVAPLIIVTFSDGAFATFTYNYEQQMTAWTRHDSVYPIEQVIGTGKPDRSFFVINKDGNRYIQVSLPRYIPTDILVDDPEADKLAPNYYMDSIASKFLLINDILDVDDFFTLDPVTPNVWDGPLNLTSDSGTIDFTSSIVGDVFRWFNPIDGAAIDLKILSFTDDFNVVVQPSEEFPEAYDESARLYLTYNVVTGLSHLEGESVSVVVDGSIVASPYNDQQNYPVITVTGGSITLPDGMLGAFIHVGRPIVGDTKTLNISTVEQSPTLIESINVNKLYVKVNDTRGLYCSNYFPEEANGEIDGHSVIKMEDLYQSFVPIGNSQLIGNRYLPGISRRLEKTIPGGWDSQGRISFRQVDPFHYEILSIIPDVTVLKRSDR